MDVTYLLEIVVDSARAQIRTQLINEPKIPYPRTADSPAGYGWTASKLYPDTAAGWSRAHGGYQRHLHAGELNIQGHEVHPFRVT